MQTTDYARWFRSSTPYISAHRNKTFVVLLGGDALAHVNLTNIVHDLALLHVLGVRLVLVHGARPQIQAALTATADEATTTDVSPIANELRITNTATMQLIAAVNGQIRTSLEALFSTGLPNSPMHNTDIPVISGNFVTAQPVGIVNGVDYLCTGQVRRVERKRVQATLAAGALVLQSPMGYSASGQAFNLAAEDLAAEIALQIQADKLIVFDDLTTVSAAGERIGTFTPATLEQVVEDFSPTEQVRLRALMRAVRGGVPKSHLVSFSQDGALLAELFTAEGVGTQVVEHQRKAVRKATANDVAGIVEVIRPLEESGALVRRERDRLEQEIEHFLVAELDGIVVGCCAVYAYDKQAELACLAVHENYRKITGGGIGASLLAEAETSAQQQGVGSLFVLTTQTREWFREQGFEDATIDILPHTRQQLYNWQRNSQVLTKALAKPLPEV